MNKDDWGNLAAFAVIAEERSFTRAATRLGVTASALSHSMRVLEERLRVRLLARTTRNVSTTDAGERLLARLRPALGDIGEALADLDKMSDRPAGRVRITAPRIAARNVIGPMLPKFSEGFPDVTVEVMIDPGFTDIIEHRFDAGIRLGEAVAQDMVSVRVSADIRASVVASPSYLAERGTPVVPLDLRSHRCIGFRFAPASSVYKWEFQKGSNALEFAPEGTLVCNDEDMMMDAALRGMGMAYLFESHVSEQVAKGQLVRVLEDWCMPFPGFFLYYPSRRQTPAGLAAFVDSLRYREP